MTERYNGKKLKNGTIKSTNTVYEGRETILKVSALNQLNC